MQGAAATLHIHQLYESAIPPVRLVPHIAPLGDVLQDTDVPSVQRAPVAPDKTPTGPWAASPRGSNYQCRTPSAPRDDALSTRQKRLRSGGSADGAMLH